MDTSAEGFSLTASVIIDSDDSQSIIGDIAHAQNFIIYDDTYDYPAFCLIDDQNTNSYIGDILRSNTGSEGFVIKTSVLLDDYSDANLIADIRHSRILESEEERAHNASLFLDDYDGGQTIGDVTRENYGSSGFSLQTVLKIDDIDENLTVGDILHPTGPRSSDSNVYYSSLILDNIQKESYVADTLRIVTENPINRIDFNLKATLNVDYNDNTKIVGDLFRSSTGLNIQMINILLYKDKRHVVLYKDKLHSGPVIE